MSSDRLRQIVENAIREGVFPGAAFATYFGGKLTTEYVGNHTYCPESPAVDATTVWDLASVSKVISTTTCFAKCFEDGLIDLDQAVVSVIPEFSSPEKDQITFRSLLVHDSGLIAFRPYHRTHTLASTVMDAVYREGMSYPTGSKMVYSDLNMILVAEALRRVTGETLDELSRRLIYETLGMHQTGYFSNGASSMRSEANYKQCAPTERIESWRVKLRRLRHGDLMSQRLYGFEPEYTQGEVHDPTATVLGGVAGHAGLFSTLDDLVRFALDFGSHRPKLLKAATRDLFTRKQGDLSTRAIGWDTKSPTGSSAGTKFGPRSFGHTGYTGTSIWFDPDAGGFAILLANRVHPTSENTKILTFRPEFHDAVRNTVMEKC
jgi:CubicO group peptidase (beta-lactamase class C family)